MYLVESFIDMGLQNDQQWPSKAHRQVAVNALIGNPKISSRSRLTAGVQAIISIPLQKIKTVTLEDLRKMNVGC